MVSVVENPASEPFPTGFARERAVLDHSRATSILKPRSPALSARTESRRGRVRLLRQQAVAVNHCGGNVDELPIRRSRVFTEHFECGRLIDRVAFHEDAL